MRKITALIILAFVIQTQVSSQSCLPNGININTQEEIDNFQTNYPDCTEIEGSVMISDQGTNSITNLNGLNTITSIGGYLIIGDNNALNNLAGLENLLSINGDMEIEHNYSLTNLEDLNSLTFIGGHLQISNNNLTSLQGLNSINTIGDYMLIFNNESILTLEGLNNLTSIGDRLSITNNELLTDLTGLESLSTIGGLIGITYNPNLTNLDGLSGVSSIGGSLFIWGNEALISIQGLNNLPSINGELRIRENESLTSLDGIDNIDASSIEELYIALNNSLSTCEIESICDYLSNPTGDITIFNNASGCDSLEEVLEACTVGIPKNSENFFIIYPNPAENIITISNKTNSSIDCVNIFNNLGKKVLTQYSCSGTIDISELNKGLFILEIYSYKLILRKKLIIK